MKHVEVVCALIQNEEGKIFCCQRGPGRALAYKWEFPGGKIEQNETQEEALIREIKEELKSDVEVIRYIGVSKHEYVDLEKPFSITMYAYLCTVIVSPGLPTKVVSIFAIGLNLIFLGSFADTMSAINSGFTKFANFVCAFSIIFVYLSFS